MVFADGALVGVVRVGDTSVKILGVMTCVESRIHPICLPLGYLSLQTHPIRQRSFLPITHHP